jgi:hypothetical protein
VGRKGVGGRKTLEFKAECARLVDEEVLPKWAKKLATSDPDDPAWRWATERVLEYSKQKMAQTVTGPGGGPIQHAIVSILLPDNGRGDRTAT